MITEIGANSRLLLLWTMETSHKLQNLKNRSNGKIFKESSKIYPIWKRYWKGVKKGCMSKFWSGPIFDTRNIWRKHLSFKKLSKVCPHYCEEFWAWWQIGDRYQMDPRWGVHKAISVLRGWDWQIWGDGLSKLDLHSYLIGKLEGSWEGVDTRLFEMNIGESEWLYTAFPNFPLTHEKGALIVLG